MPPCESWLQSAVPRATGVQCHQLKRGRASRQTRTPLRVSLVPRFSARTHPLTVYTPGSSVTVCSSCGTICCASAAVRRRAERPPRPARSIVHGPAARAFHAVRSPPAGASKFGFFTRFGPVPSAPGSAVRPPAAIARVSAPRTASGEATASVSKATAAAPRQTARGVTVSARAAVRGRARRRRPVQRPRRPGPRRRSDRARS